MPTRKDEAVASRPFWVAWIMSQVSSPNCVSHGGGTHGESGVSRIGLLNAICREKAQGIDGAKLQACAELV